MNKYRSRSKFGPDAKEPGYAQLARLVGFDFAFFVVKQCLARKDPSLLSAIIVALELSDTKGDSLNGWYNKEPSARKRMVLEMLGMGLPE